MASTSTTTKAKATTKPPVKPATPPAKPVKATTLKTPVTVKALLMGSGNYDWVIHNEPCKTYPANKKRSAYAGMDDYVIEDVLNQRDVIMEVWGDQIAETFTADDKTGDDYATATWGWLSKNGYVHSVSFHTCLDGLPQISSKTAAKSSEATKKATKTELATRVALAAAAMLDQVFAASAGQAASDSPEAAFLADLLVAFGDEASARQCVAQWMHGMPVDRDRWYNAGLPIPQRSDWADYQPPAASATAALATDPKPDTTDTPATER